MPKEIKEWIVEILDVAPELDPYNISRSMHNKHSPDEVAQAMYELEQEGKLPHRVVKIPYKIETTIEPDIRLGDETLESVINHAEGQKKKKQAKETATKQ